MWRDLTEKGIEFPDNSLLGPSLLNTRSDEFRRVAKASFIVNNDLVKPQGKPNTFNEEGSEPGINSMSHFLTQTEARRLVEY